MTKEKPVSSSDSAPQSQTTLSDKFIESLLPDAEEISALSAQNNIGSEEPTISESSSIPFDDTETPWLWNGEPIHTIDFKQWRAFVYLITNKITGKRYIGFKTTVARKTRTVKGKKRRTEVESDWQSYWSSSDPLHADIALYGRGNFLREIIWLAPMKGVGKYLELQEQVERGVLTRNAERYYNGIVDVRLGANAIRRYDEAVRCSRPPLGDVLAESTQDPS